MLPAAEWMHSGPPGQDVANRLRLLLYSRELLGEVLDRVAKEAGLGHGGIKEPDFVRYPSCRPDTAREAFGPPEWTSHGPLPAP